MKKYLIVTSLLTIVALSHASQREKRPSLQNNGKSLSSLNLFRKKRNGSSPQLQAASAPSEPDLSELPTQKPRSQTPMGMRAFNPSNSFQERDLSEAPTRKPSSPSRPNQIIDSGTSYNAQMNMSYNGLLMQQLPASGPVFMYGNISLPNDNIDHTQMSCLLENHTDAPVYVRIKIANAANKDEISINVPNQDEEGRFLIIPKNNCHVEFQCPKGYYFKARLWPFTKDTANSWGCVDDKSALAGTKRQISMKIFKQKTSDSDWSVTYKCETVEILK